MGTILMGLALIAFFLSAVFGWFSGKSKKLAEDAHNRKLRIELESFMIGVRSEIEAQTTKYAKREEYIAGLRAAFSRDFATGRKWLASYIAEADRALDESIAHALEKKKPPAPKAAKEILIARRERRVQKEQATLLKYQLMTIREYFPFIADYEDVILNEEMDFLGVADGLGLLVDGDPVLRILGKKDYEQMSVGERNQLALDRYLGGKLSPVAIGKLYERFVGYRYESTGWSVEYHGIAKGLEDLGRDLVCKKNEVVKIVQAKCWSTQKLIHEKHIFQLFGTTQMYLMDKAQDDLLPQSVSACLTTSTLLSPVAKNAAKWLGIDVCEGLALDKSFPMIKCNIGKKSRERIYHLPFDQQYDRVSIETSTGEFYASTVRDAEAAGFRRAFKFSGTKVG